MGGLCLKDAARFLFVLHNAQGTGSIDPKDRSIDLKAIELCRTTVLEQVDQKMLRVLCLFCIMLRVRDRSIRKTDRSIPNPDQALPNERNGTDRSIYLDLPDSQLLMLSFIL